MLLNSRGPNLEGCNLCDNFEFGCCGDELSPAAGPDMEVSRQENLRHERHDGFPPRAVAVRPVSMAAVSMVARPQDRSSEDVLTFRENIATNPS